MKKMLSVVLLSLSAVSVQAAEMGIGLGIIAGTPTGLTFKKWSDSTTALTAAAEWSTSSNEKFHFHADMLTHDFNLIQAEEVPGKVGFYYGYGGLVQLNEGKKKETVLGLRIPIGISLMFNKQPIEVFVEVVPTLNLVPDTEVEVNSAIGGRYYF